MFGKPDRKSGAFHRKVIALKKIAETSSLTIEELKQQNAKLELQNAELTAKLNWLKEQFRLSQQKRFGASSEQTHPEQLQLFNEAEAEAEPSKTEPTLETITYNRKKQSGQREAMLENLPTEIIEYHLPKEEQACSCGYELHAMNGSPTGTANHPCASESGGAQALCVLLPAL